MLEKIYRPALLVLLVTLVITQILVLAVDISRANACKQGAAAISETLKNMPADYKKDVYNNPQVDNINKQQLIVAEYQFYTQQAIAQLLAACQ